VNWMAGHDVARVMAYCFEAFPPGDADDAAATEGAGGRRYALVAADSIKKGKKKAAHGPTLTELRSMGSTYKTFQKRCWAWLKENFTRVGSKTGSKIVGEQWQRRKVQMGRPVTKKSATRRRKATKTTKRRKIAVRTAGARTWSLVPFEDDDWMDVMLDEWEPRFDVALRDDAGFVVGPFRYDLETDLKKIQRFSRPVADLLVDMGYGWNHSVIEVINGTWEDDFTIALKEVRTLVGVNTRTGKRFVESFVRDRSDGWYHSPRLTREIRNYLSL